MSSHLYVLHATLTNDVCGDCECDWMREGMTAGLGGALSLAQYSYMHWRCGGGGLQWWELEAWKGRRSLSG